MPQPIDMKRFEQLKAASELPSPRGVAIAIIRLAQSPDVSMGELGRVIKGDPAFVGRLIKAANGVVGENGRSVVSVQDALMVLGLPAVRAMALGFSLLSNYRKGACTAFDYARFWTSSVLMALSMQALARRLRVIPADDAFSVGLLARIGELALATIYPVDFALVLRKVAASPDARQLDLEQAAFALTHCELGAAMLSDWGIPAQLLDPVRFFETPEYAGFAEGSREAGLMQCLVLSRAIAQLCLAPESEHARLIVPMMRLSSRLGLERGEFVMLCERVGRDWGEWAKLLQLDGGRLPTFTALVAEEETVSAAATAEGETQQGAGATSAQSPAMPLAGTAQDAPADEPMRLLIVGVTGAEGALICEALDPSEFVVLEEPDCSLAVDRVIDLQPQLMVLNWGSEHCGQTFIQALRSARFGRFMYVLGLLDRDDEGLLLEATAAGVDDVLVRPLQRNAVTVRLRAGRRTVGLQRQLEYEREELRHFAAELSISNRRLAEAAMTDPLTGLPNRRYAMDRMEMEWAACKRHDRPLSVMVVDLDNFKVVNDLHGHDIGDMVLRQLADALRKVLRAQDVVCRMGGDEFLVICPDSDLPQAIACAERLRAAADELRVETGGPELNVSVSVGVATYDPSITTMAELIKLADRAAFLAKGQGRNRVVASQRRSPSA